MSNYLEVRYPIWAVAGISRLKVSTPEIMIELRSDVKFLKRVEFCGNLRSSGGSGSMCSNLVARVETGVSNCRQQAARYLYNVIGY